MEKIPILRMGEFLLVTIQVDMHDRLAMTLQEDLTTRINETGARGVLIDISSLEIVDSFIGRMLGNIAAMSRVLDAQTVVVGMQPAVAAVEKRGVRGDRQQQRQHRSQAIDRAHGPVDVPHAHVHVQAEGVVAPCDVLQPVLHPTVVLGVDDRLLAVVGPRMGPRRPQRGTVRRCQREQAATSLALARQGVVQVDAHA